LTANAIDKEIVWPTALKSFRGSNCRPCFTAGWMMKLGKTTSSVWPAPGARAASSYPITAPAPGRFSAITGCPRPFAMRSPRSRLVISAAPPGGKGTMMRRGFEGNDCA